jgi:hypothetical protein
MNTENFEMEYRLGKNSVSENRLKVTLYGAKLE